MNAEVVLGNVGNLYDAVSWFERTYLHIRMKSNPEIYHVNDMNNYQTKINLMHSVAYNLSKLNIIQYDIPSGSMKPTALGTIVSHYYLSLKSVKVYNDTLGPEMSIIDVLRVFSYSAEFSQIPIREEEK